MLREEMRKRGFVVKWRERLEGGPLLLSQRGFQIKLEISLSRIPIKSEDVEFIPTEFEEIDAVVHPYVCRSDNR